MPHALSWIDRLRIERVVWTLDHQLYDLPHRTRIARRREVRQDLLAAAGDIGTSAALRGLGGTGRLAAEYLAAELGDEPRAHWTAAAVTFLAVLLVTTSMVAEASNAFLHGLRAADPTATGTFSWDGFDHLTTKVTATLVEGRGNTRGGALTPLAYLLLVALAVGVGRLWRARSLRRLTQRFATTDHATTDDAAAG